MDNLDSATDNLISTTKRLRNTIHLIQWLRAGRTVTPELAKFIANILSGEVNASLKRPKHLDVLKVGIMRDIINHSYSTERSRLQEISNQIRAGQKPENWQDIDDELKSAGYIGELDTKGEITNAAKLITAWKMRMTLSQLDELLVKRERQKTRKK